LRQSPSRTWTFSSAAKSSLAAAARALSISVVKNGVWGGSAETIQAAPTQVPVPISATRARPREAEDVEQAADLGPA
jgi:hypothetical protein